MTGELDLSKLLEVRSDDTVFLRQLTPADAQAYFDLIDHDRSHFKHGEEVTSEKYQTVQDVLDSFDKARPGYYRFGIWENGVMVGSANLEVQEQDERAAEVGYWVGAKHSGHNYAARAASLIQDFAFRNLGLGSIFAEINPENLASIRSVEKAGFILISDDSPGLRFGISREQWEGNND